MEKLSPAVINAAGALSLGLLLTIACWTDLHSRRISNKLIFAGTLIGFTLHVLLQVGSGLFSLTPGSLNTLDAILGFVTGLALLLPLYVLRVMGAGDVKFMAMIGIFLGPASVVGATLMTFIAGGILAVGMALYKGLLRNTFENVRLMVTHTIINTISGHRLPVTELVNSTTKLPYALAISVGTVLHILMARNGHAIIF